MEADKPFDSTSLADTVIRSSDDVHFYVLGAFLRYVSPTFRDMFSLSRGSAAEENEIKDGYPVIPLSEDKETIHYLLSNIHPYINKPKSDDSRLLIKVWKMAQKYGMDTVVCKLQKHLLGCMVWTLDRTNLKCLSLPLFATGKMEQKLQSGGWPRGWIFRIVTNSRT